jgi:phytoene synthase
MNDAILALVRRSDPDRFLTALLAPADRRDALLTLYAFDHELARAPEVTREPMLALIRLQWWREVVEGEPRRHEVATPLRALLDDGSLRPPDLLPLIEAREQAVEEPLATLADWRAWQWSGSGGLAVAAARLLGAADPEAARPWGAAYGAGALLRDMPRLAARRRCLLPLDLLAEQDLSPEAAMAEAGGPRVQAILARLASEAQGWLRAAPALRGPAAIAALPGLLARRDLARWPRVLRERPLGDRLAVIGAGLLRRVG